jgi:spermidine/putrescine-binding protein
VKDNFIGKDLTRRNLLRVAGLAGLGAVAVPLLNACSTKGTVGAAGASASASQSPAKTLNFLCWEGYTDKSFADGFTAKYGTQIKSTFIGSNDELVAQLTSGAGNFDLISPSVDTTKSLIDAKLVQPLDMSKVPNWSNSYGIFQNNASVKSGTDIYGVPMSWGFVPIIVNLDAIPKPADSWSILWDKQYKGKISVWDDITSIYNTALLLGYKNVYSLSPTQLAAVKVKMLEQKPLLTKYWANAGELTNLFANRETIVGNSFGGTTLPDLRKQGFNVKEYIPQEGATAWVDFWMVPAKSKNRYTAELWMNYIQQPDIQAQINKVTGYAPTGQAAAKLLPAAVVDQYSLNNPSSFDRLLFWEQVPNRQQYLDLLNQVKAA